jgi:arylsulfatase A-like enzyme
MSSFRFLILAFCIGVCGVAWADQELARFQKVILISVDTLRADYLGSYNPKMKTTPQLDRFAAENILFKNVTSQSATTAPSHKSIFYSVYPSIHKTTLRQVPVVKEKSPIEVIRSHGFKTAAFTGGGQLSPSFGFARAFETYWEPQQPAKGRLKEVEELVFDWLEENSNDKFFLFLHTYETHCPYDPPPMFFQKWSGWYKGQIQKGNCYPQAFFNQQRLPVDLKYVRSLYSAEVNYVDNFLGVLFQKLKTMGIYDDTLIIFISDHGESLGEHGYIGHNQLYQVQLHVPLILHVPGIAGSQYDVPIESIDIMPTIFELLGIESKLVSFQGKSLMPLVREQEAPNYSRPLISEEKGRVRVRIGNIAMIFAPDGRTSEELYDLKADPSELHNVAKENPKIVEQMKVPYTQMIANSKELSAQFILEPDKKTELSEETAEQMRALGYITQ